MDYKREQLHAGSKPENRLVDGSPNKIWHTNTSGKYWIGWTPHDLTPEELYYATITTLTDLIVNHPELRKFGK